MHSYDRPGIVKWDFSVLPYTNSEVRDYCTNDPEWQRFRLTLKGVPTFKKVEMLRIRRASYCGSENMFPPRKYQVQLDNYINALRRGGQLNDAYEVVK